MPMDEAEQKKKQIAEIKNYMEALTIGDDDVIREAVDDKQ